MMFVLALSLNSPMMLMFGIVAAAALGGAAGLAIGTTMGRTPPETPLSTTLRLTRERLASSVARIEKASSALNSAHKSDLAGTGLVLGRRLSEFSSRLGGIQHKSKRKQGGTA